MKAIVWTAYGPPEVLQLREVEKPVPADDEILVRVRATTVTAGETELRRFRFWGVLTVPIRLFIGLIRPRGQRILGQELAGDVVEIGKDVTRFDVGDRVCAHTGLRFGGAAEYAALRERGMIARIPESLSYELAATLPTAGLYALYFVRRGQPTEGQSVLIIGGGGSIGSFAIQLVKRSGAEVTAVDRTDKLEFMRSLGADHVIDYTQQDFTDVRGAYDLILDVVDKSWFHSAAKSLRPGGLYVHSNLSLTRLIQTRFSRYRRDRNVGFVADGNDRDGLTLLAGMIQGGQLESVIDRTFPLEQTAAAHEYAETGNKRGHIVISVD